MEKAGFRVIRQKGSHAILMNEERVRIVVPIHRGRDVKVSLLRAILREAGLDREEFFRLLEGDP